MESSAQRSVLPISSSPANLSTKSMAAFNKILVPVDFSECSSAALKQALMLRETLGARVEVVHSFDVPTFIPPHVVVMMGEVDATLSEHAERHANEQLREFLDRQGVPADSQVTSKVLLGPPAPTILEAAEEGHFDLIVMGTHGRTGLPRLFMGSTAEKVLRHAHCPVLTVRVATEQS